jgi:hypothetical protein
MTDPAMKDRCDHRFVRGRASSPNGIDIDRTWVECAGCGTEMDPAKYSFFAQANPAMPDGAHCKLCGSGVGVPHNSKCWIFNTDTRT